MFEDKKVLIGVSGGIAAYKTASLVSRLHKAGVEVHVIMTENATEFISPLVFETLSGQRCVVDTFDKNRQFEVEHVSLAKLADLFMIAPATANVIAKAANGLADDMLTTTFLASNCPKMVVPAMNTQMYLNPVTQDNLKKLKKNTGSRSLNRRRDSWPAEIRERERCRNRRSSTGTWKENLLIRMILMESIFW